MSLTSSLSICYFYKYYTTQRLIKITEGWYFTFSHTNNLVTSTFMSLFVSSSLFM